MTVYLVDFENVKSDGLYGIDDLSGNDTVYIFYSVNVDKISFAMHKKINDSKADIKTIKVEVGHKNALDFQLSSYLGFLLHEDSAKEYVIVSNDAGFGPLVSFWKKKNYNIILATDLTKLNQKQKYTKLYNQVKGLVEDNEQAKLLTDCILKYKTKQGLNNAIVKVYGTTIGGKLYKAIKPLIMDKKGK
ncbi:MAG: PIN domain-containing protein [Erysipelotrichaceae bacterium]